MRTNYGAGLVAGLMLWATAACGGGDDGTAEATDKPFRVVFVSGQTGVLATPAKAVARGIRAYVNEANANGGIDGREIELEVLDNQSDPTRGVTLIQDKITGDDKPDLVIPGISSNEALAAAPILSRAGVLTIQASASPLLDDVDKYPFFFSTVLTHKVIYESMVDHIKSEDPDANKIALVAPEDAIGDATQQFFKGAFGKAGFTLTEHRFKGDSVDLSPTFQAAADEDPDWIVMEGAGAQVATLVSSRLKAGAETIPTIVGSSASSQPILDISTEAQRENLYNTLAPGEVWVEPEDRSEEFARFVEAVKAQGELESPLSVYEAGWDAMYIWSRAVESVDGEVTADKLKKALETLGDYEDEQVPAYGGGGGYSAKSHFHPGSAEDFRFGRIVEKRDGMSVLQQ